MKRTARPSREMEWGRGCGSKLASKIALLLSGDDGMVQTALIVPLIASISFSYPDASEWLLDQVMAVTATMMLPSILISSKLARDFNKKRIMMFGTVLFSLAGVCGMFAPNIYILILTRAVLGVGAGLAFPLVPSTITYLFRGKEKDRMLGWMNSMGAFFSFTLSIIAGVIALTSWRYAFLFYLLFIPVAVVQYFVLPEFKPEKQEIVEKLATGVDSDNPDLRTRLSRRGEPLGWRVWGAGLCMLCFMIVAMVATFKLSLFVELSGIGTSADSGMGTSAMTCASFFISLVFANYLGLFKRFAPVVSLLFLAAAFLLLSVSQTTVMVIAAMAVLGLAMGTLNPFLFSTMSRIAPATRTTLGMSLMCVFQLGGQIITPYYMILAGVLGFGDVRRLFAFTAALVVAVTIVVFLIVLVARRPAGQGEVGMGAK